MRRRDAIKVIGAGALAALTRPGAAVAATKGSVVGTVTLTKKNGKTHRDHSDVVVYLVGVPQPAAAGNRVIEIRQKNEQFDPRVEVARVGEKISFPNEDRFHHNVYSTSNALEFDLGLYKSGSTKIVTTERPGTIEVLCNLHPRMRATILVLETRHYDMTDKDGHFKIRGVPPGTYEYVAWQASGDEVRGAVTVVAGEDSTVALSCVKVDPPPRITDKDGKPVGRY